MLPGLTYCILNFFCSTPWGVIYVLYIITDFFHLFTKKLYRITSAATALMYNISLPLRTYYQYIFCTFIGYRSLPCLSAPFFRDLCPYIITDFLGKISRYDTFFNAYLYLFINHHLTANQSVCI